MNKLVEGSKESYNTYYNEVNQNILTLDNVSGEAVTSLSAVGTKVKQKNRSNFNLTKALIQVMYERGEINRATYEKAIKTLEREVKIHESRR